MLAIFVTNASFPFSLSCRHLPGTDLRNLTLSSVTTILETVVPAIAEHEIVEVWLAHDMVGYVGVEALVYRAFAKVMEQTEAGDVVVRKGDSATGEKAATVEGSVEERDLNLCDGIEEGVKLAKVAVFILPFLPVIWLRKEVS